MKRSRIVFLIENMSFPRDRRVRQETAVFVRMGCECSVVCPKGITQNTKTFELIGGVKVYRYPQPWQGRSVSGYLCEYAWALLCSFALVVWIWAKDGLDVIHAANPPDFLCLIAAPFLLIQKKFVFDQHDLCPELLEAKMGKTAILSGIVSVAERWSYRLASLVIVTNQSAYDIALMRGASSENVCIVRNGPDLDYFVKVPADESLKHGAEYLALYIGSLAAQDGVDRILKAVHHIVYERGRSDVKFAILGDGDCLTELQKLSRSLGIESYVDFPGWLGDAQVLRYISTADVCLSPDPPCQLNHRSTFIKIMEYMCFGKVTVSFDLLESRRSAGPTAVYVKEDSPTRFGDAIVEILDAPELREKMGKMAAERVRTSLHWGISRRALVDAYERVIWDGLPLNVGTVEVFEGTAIEKCGEVTFIDKT